MDMELEARLLGVLFVLSWVQQSRVGWGPLALPSGTARIEPGALQP
jgi:hypothetical protein